MFFENSSEGRMTNGVGCIRSGIITSLWQVTLVFWLEQRQEAEILRHPVSLYFPHETLS